MRSTFVSTHWPEPGEPAYVSVPYTPDYQVHVVCPSCGSDHIMPMDGPIPLNDRREVDWDRLNPPINRFARILADKCATVFRGCYFDPRVIPQDQA